MAFFYEADPPEWNYSRGYKREMTKFPNKIAKQLERLWQKCQKGETLNTEITWNNSSESNKEYKINVQSMTMEDTQQHYRYSYRSAIEISREGYPYPKMGNRGKLTQFFSKFSTNNKIDQEEDEEAPMKLFQAAKVNGATVDGLIFHAIADANDIFTFQVDTLAENFAKIGCNSKGDIDKKIQEIKRTLFGRYTDLDKTTKNTRKKQFKKLMTQLFKMSTGGKEAIRQLPFIEAPSAGEEEVRGDEDDSEEEETRMLPLIYNLVYVASKKRFPLAERFLKFMESNLEENKKYGLTKDEWSNIAEFLFTVQKKSDTDPDGWPILIETFLTEGES